MTQPAFDPCCCPLCGQPNACAMARPLAAAPVSEPCWCTRVHFSADVLKQVPPAARHRACICAACAQPSPAAPTGDAA